MKQYAGQCKHCGRKFTKKDYANAAKGDVGDECLVGDYDDICYPCQFKYGSGRTANIELFKGGRKSTIAASVARYLDPNFNLDNVVFTVDQLNEQIDTCPPKSAIVFDEAIMGTWGKNESKLNKLLFGGGRK